ncbi:MAG: dTDP-4-dehydrorhamnose reductase [Sulfurimonas sp.]|nr:dTDP-4-dehydrorhamnose reductase [Sulfurimonas sp.]
MSNILVTGSQGQLGSEIKELSKEYRHTFYFTCRDELDITNHKQTKEFIEKHSINTIINCAAYTAVDKAQENKDLADAINHQAVKNLAQIAKDKEIRLIHISTDYVFDGKNHQPYKESDPTNPASIYGETKLLGEKAMQEINPKNSIIIRTSWVYSAYGANFVKTMLRLGKERGSLGVVYDQVGTPTYARDLAKTLLDILPKVTNEKVRLYHYSSEGVCSWYDFAKEIMRMAKIECEINPLESHQYPTPAPRPHYSVLNKSKIKEEFNITIPYYKDSLERCLKILGERK